MATVELLPVEGVYRKCRDCEQWKSIGNFHPGRPGQRPSHVCNLCAQRRAGLIAGGGRGGSVARGIRLTPEGIAAIRESEAS